MNFEVPRSGQALPQLGGVLSVAAGAAGEFCFFRCGALLAVDDKDNKAVGAELVADLVLKILEVGRVLAVEWRRVVLPQPCRAAHSGAPSLSHEEREHIDDDAVPACRSCSIRSRLRRPGRSAPHLIR